MFWWERDKIAQPAMVAVGTGDLMVLRGIQRIATDFKVGVAIGTADMNRSFEV
jgi:hypothetical protein